MRMLRADSALTVAVELHHESREGRWHMRARKRSRSGANGQCTEGLRQARFELLGYARRGRRK